MRGRKVERRFGWDTHGLPAELEAMRLDGIKTTDEILELGIEKFNEACRASVMKYTGEWREYVTRQARWVDFDHDYRTYEPDYMESVIWAFKQLYDKGWVYEGFRVLPYCWNDETPLSNHELRMDDDVYRNARTRRSPSASGSPAARRRARWPSSGRRPRGPCRATWRSWSARTSTTSWSRSDVPGTDELLPARRAAARGVRAGVRRDPEIAGAAQGRRAGRQHLHAAVLLLPRAASARSASSPPTRP